MSEVDVTRKYAYIKDKRPLLKTGYTDFNGSRQILSKKRKYNMKYHIYDKHTSKKIILDEVDAMTVLDIIELNDEKIIFYTDSHKKISFIRTKQKNLSIENIIDKVEKTPMFKNTVFPFLFYFVLFGVMRFRNYTFHESQLSLGYDKSINYKIRFLFPLFIREKFSMKTDKPLLLFHLYWCFIPMKDIYHHYLKTSDINTPIFIRIINDGINYFYNMKKDSKDKYNKKHYLYNTISCKIPKSNSELFIRKSITGQYVVVVTSIMKKSVILKELCAYLLTLFKRDKEKYDIYFEKFTQGASESGFELFKHAFTKKNLCVYILDKENTNFDKLKEKYGRSLVAKNSFLSFYYIFLAKNFISSDLISHLQRRLYDNDYLFKKKVLKNKNKIFLQHGPSLATNIFERGYFNQKVPIAPDYIVVSSKFEKHLFLENTSYKDKQIISMGIPNLDLYVKEKEKKKEEITFMLTWRPWDLTGSIEKGSYLDRYSSFLKLVTEEEYYKDKKVNIILHPKAKIILKEQFPHLYEEYRSYFYDGDIKNALLRTKVLISDYSSIVYYAFAGGSNVVFFWEDKEKAEEEYGAPNILQKENVFGDIAMNMLEVNEAIKKNYKQKQSTLNKKRYSLLIECCDGNNTEKTYNYIHHHLS